MQKSLIILILLILLLGAGFFFLQRQEPVEDDAGTQTEATKEQLLVSLKSAAEAEDYPAFAQRLQTVYEKGWNKDMEFESIESSAYVKADKTYFIPGDYEKTLEISTIVYNLVPQGWRFQYLRVLALEKLGRMALESPYGGSPAGRQAAEDYANTILKMTFRPEGANLLADVYMKKIEESLQTGNVQEAQAAYLYIKDFEVSEDRRARLNELMFIPTD